MRSDVAQPAAIVLAGGLALLGGALAFEHLGGLVPCEMCIWQRQAIAAALVLATLALVLTSRAVAALAAVAMLGNAAIAGFHAGVEQKWWEGITRCATTPSGGSTADIIGAILATPLVRCDAIPWSLFGISMAGWNFIIASIIGALALWRLKA
ncbi:dihydroneopterin aldolase [Polymorphobacter multimanifer]|uniref:disulfide bond formation protein B n=1 Tax=Polymorphobacter multimanifer TaxID=1070431 RepID=UPI0019A06EFE|nr:disulfide bond formation protein B [Polymorphobacter multimanifer]GGI67228.1 dihydroneopterin aldolase [Polymorphobacter multimanifer]